jgi:hypothetical protein
MKSVAPSIWVHLPTMYQQITMVKKRLQEGEVFIVSIALNHLLQEQFLKSLESLNEFSQAGHADVTIGP